MTEKQETNDLLEKANQKLNTTNKLLMVLTGTVAVSVIAILNVMTHGGVFSI